MRVPIGWLREFVRLEDLDIARLCEILTMGGLEVESVEELGAEIAGVVVGEIVRAEPHPNADKLTVCQVRSGGAPVTVVCGATNMKAGDHVAYAPPGTVLPGNRRIESAAIRGVESAGMLCSEAELGLSGDASGILILASDAPLGERLGAHLGVEDTVLDVSVTPNRGDCLSVLGIAREVAALTGQRLLRPRLSVRERGTAASDSIRVRVDDPSGCTRYAARLVRGVRVGPSPLWLQRRLLAVGLRPINNVVDVTNLVMMERGQPLHAFDYDRLPAPEIVVRRAGATASIRTLDGVVRSLAPDDLLITAGEEPIALAGVMGGLDSEVGDATTGVLLEAAWFDPGTVRRTARRLDLRSEAAFRFERGVDVDGVPIALHRAAALLRQVAGGEVAPGVVEAYPGAHPPAPIAVRPRRVEELLGFALGRAEITATLKLLGAAVGAGPRGVLSVVPPTFRLDLTREIDVIEEIARIAGYARIPTTMPQVRMQGGALPIRLRRERELKQLLAAHGLSEIISLSFASSRQNELFPGVSTNGGAVAVLNPMTREDSEMRRSLLGGLVTAWRANCNQGVTGVGGFSIGKVFWQAEGNREGWRLAGLLAGDLSHTGIGKPRAVEFADAKGVVEAVFDRLHVLDTVRWERWAEGLPFHPGKTGVATLGGQIVGALGALHPEVEVELGVDGAHWLFELDLEKVLPYCPARLVFRGLPRYPAVVRDLAIVADEDFASDRVVQFVRSRGRDLVEDIELFDEYVGVPIPAGKKSLAYSIAYRAPDRTLTDDEVNSLHDELTRALSRELGVEPRQ